MTKFIEVTSSLNNSKMLINIDSISSISFNNNSSGGSVIDFIYGGDDILSIKESYAQIMGMIGKKNNGLNWRDASKELPESELEWIKPCLILLKTADDEKYVSQSHYDESKGWNENDIPEDEIVTHWLYCDEIPHPEDDKYD